MIQSLPCSAPILLGKKKSEQVQILQCFVLQPRPILIFPVSFLSFPELTTIACQSVGSRQTLQLGIVMVLLLIGMGNQHKYPRAPPTAEEEELLFFAPFSFMVNNVQ